jgi:hypothetical protein
VELQGPPDSGEDEREPMRSALPGFRYLPRMKELGWSGCMHDPDCDCSLTVLAKDGAILITVLNELIAKAQARAQTQ